MAQKTAAELIDFINANIDTNGVNAITGANMNTILKDLVDSLVNKSSDSLLIVTNVYRSGVQAMTAAEVQVTFSTAMPNNSYDVVIEDADGIGFENITDKQTTGFKITGLSTGNLVYFVILTN